MTQSFRRPMMTMVALGCGALALAGCFGPTYGTGTTAGDQLVNDLSNALSLRARSEGPPINYSPRPDIIQPTDSSVLPPPQENIAEAAGQEWPESPEERRARVLRSIDEGERDPNFVTNPSQVAAIGASEGPGRVSAGAGQRVFLTDPPAEYRQPAPTADYGELGPTEAQKARAAERAQNDRRGWRRLVPWL